MPNVAGNRRADETLAEDQGMNRRVRFTVGLGIFDNSTTDMNFPAINEPRS